jgi:hypothetical protein
MQKSTLAALAWIVAGPAVAGDATLAPSGAKPIITAEADGVQIYACAAQDGKFRWIFQAPEAALFDIRGRQIGSHGKGPTWALLDGSSVIGEVTAKEPAPEKGAIPWLLLTVKSRAGVGLLNEVVYIRRIDTRGGSEPTEGCDEAHKGEVARMRYSATYQFLAK